jgi:HEAT repeat protein
MVNRGLHPLSRARRATIAASVILGMLIVVASLVLSQGGRTLADWQRDLRDPAVDVRVRAAQALVAFDQRAVPVLTGALGDKEYRVRASAADALVKMPSSDVVPGMIEALRKADPSIRANAAVVLGAFGPAAKHAVPALARALRDPNLRVRELAGEALNRIAFPGPNQPTTLPLNCH